MSGWLIRTPYAGVDPNTRPITELWAAWIEDAATAVTEVEKASGTGTPETFCQIPDELLEAIGLRVGQLARVHAEF